MYGIIREKTNETLILEVQDIGYEIIINDHTMKALPEVGSKHRVFLYYYAKEDCHELYGFISEDYRNIFISLISVSGIGPKAAMKIISTISPREIVLAIMTENLDMLTACHGIGKKTAQRIILDLKEKVADRNWSLDCAQIVIENDFVNEANEVLETLGFSPFQARQAILKVSVDGKNTQDIVKEALKHIGA